MDSGLIVRPTTGATPTGVSRPQPVEVRQGAPTLLTPSQSVTAAAEATPTRNDPARPAPTEPSNVHDVIVDPATRELIYRVVNVQSGEVISQVPDPTSLQLAAYTQAVDKAEQQGKTPAEAQAKADLDLQV